MNKKRIIFTLCVVALLVSAFAASRNASSTPARPTSPLQPETSHAAHTVPEHVVYAFWFGKVNALNQRTRELQAQGRIGRTSYLPVQHEAGLTQAQARALSEIAAACMQEVTQKDERARIIIEAFRAQFPERRIPAGVTPPPPPPELRTMWEERNTIILRARDRLRAAFGEEAFTRFDNYAKFRYGTNTAPAAPVPARPASN